MVKPAGSEISLIHSRSNPAGFETISESSWENPAGSEIE